MLRDYSLPSLNGYGNVRSPKVAMSEDAGLRAQVEALSAMTTADAADFGTAIEAMILRWHRVEGAVEDGRGKYVDGQHVAAMEAYVGQSFNGGFGAGRRSHVHDYKFWSDAA